MRGLAAVFLAGCLSPSAGPFDNPRQIDDPPLPGCHGDSECAGQDVCTRSQVCLPPDQVWAVHATWTVSGALASQTSCASALDLRIDFDSTIGPGRVSFAPVPCVAGKFTIDKVPRWFDHVALGRESGGTEQEARIDPVTGEATLDLPY